MTSIIPITLIGENLGQRHQYLNNLVQKAFENEEDFNLIKEAKEISPIDRLFKIDLANKLENEEYIVQNLKDDDLLYVSRALKSKWLINHGNIINPEYLENSLYPDMLTTAITKVRHWLYINLRDEERCKQFYDFYKQTDFKYSLKFFYNSPKEYIRKEFTNIIEKITPNYFGILCEKCPEVANIFFDSIQTNNSLRCLYCSKERKYFECLKRLLKSNSNIYLDLIEKYQNMNCPYNRSLNTTKYIMRNHKDKVMKKPELYAYCILDLNTFAEMLNEDENKNLVIALARANYLKRWFNYKKVEPFIKRLNVNERALFKKKIFVEKDIGNKIEDWPYDIPKPPQPEEYKSNIFEDFQIEPRSYEFVGKRKKIRKKCRNKFEDCEIFESGGTTKTLLNKLFDEYRFCSFEKTLYELRKRILAESSHQNREFMMLVLISKSGGRFDAIASLMEVFMQHSNEPANVRAAIIRSFVKRASIWRLPEEIWRKILEFGHGLGLDEKKTEVECIEGFHAVIIRSLIQDDDIDPIIFKEFLKKITNFSKYSLTSPEKKQISIKLPKFLLSMAKETDSIEDALNVINKLIDTLKLYKINVEKYSDTIITIKKIIEKDYEACQYLLKTLYESKIARKDLFRYTFYLNQTDTSYINALKHDINVLDFEKMIHSYKDDCLKPERFLRKLSLYFNEDNGLNKQCVEELKNLEHNKMFGRSLAIVLGKEFDNFLDKVDDSKEFTSKQLSAQLRANAHFVRPTFDITKRDWNCLGAKILTNKYIICRKTDVQRAFDKFIHFALTTKLAFELSKRVNIEIVALEEIAKLKSNYAIKIGLKMIQKNFNSKVWEIIKPLIERLDLSKQNKVHLLKYLENVYTIPYVIRADYSVVLYQLCKKGRCQMDLNIPENYFQPAPYLAYIEMYIEDVEEIFLKKELIEFLNELTVENVSKKFSADFSYDYIRYYLLYIRILIKFLLNCKSEEIQKERMESIGKPYMEKLKLLKESSDTKGIFKTHFLNEILLTLKYTNAFINTNYVSCIPVLEIFVKWFQEMLPLEKNVKVFVYIHLTMLYCKTLRQSVKNYPEIFSNEGRKVAEGSRIVGNIFGKYIAKEVNELTTKYFESVIELYRETLKYYINTYFSEESIIFKTALVKGILEGSKGPEYRLGVYLLKDVSYEIYGEDIKKITEKIKEKDDEQVKFFTFAELFM